MLSWDIFCRVVDNYGDVGVCWRLARQLAAERHGAVRLWVDQPAALARIWPEVDAAADIQHCAGVDIRRWSEPLPPVTPHAVVIEAFACKTPDSFVELMAARIPPPVWINLEYLSAEAWVDDCHMLPSPHPRLPLTKYFYFPGFTPRTGGLLRERDLLASRDAVREDCAERDGFWRGLGLPPPEPGELRISLFSYANAAAADLFAAWVASVQPIACVVPEGILRDELAAFFGGPPATGTIATRGNLRVAVIPFLRQTDYDRLLWACDINFIRGEDSFVRAQWAGRPLVWHIYPQEADAHRAKLHAFVERHCAALEGSAALAVRRLFEAWNGDAADVDVTAAWTAAQARLPDWTAGAAAWTAGLSTQRDLAGALAETVEKRL